MPVLNNRLGGFLAPDRPQRCVFALFSRIVVVACTIVLLGGGTVADAQASSQTASQMGSKSASVIGYLRTNNDAAIIDASVQLRHTVGGEVVGTTTTNSEGAFAFDNLAPGTYLVECVSNTGQVLALGRAFTVASGETVATVVRMSNSIPMVIPDLAGNGAPLGKWLDTVGVARPVEFQIVKEGDKHFLIRTPDQEKPSRTQLVERKALAGERRRFADLESSSGEFYIIDGNGDLALYDADGFIRIAKMVKQDGNEVDHSIRAVLRREAAAWLGVPRSDKRT